jgi:hypothetical protein
VAPGLVIRNWCARNGRLGGGGQRRPRVRRGLCTPEYRRTKEMVGPNTIQFSVDSLPQALCKEFLTAFYLYQLLTRQILLFRTLDRLRSTLCDTDNMLTPILY